MKRFAYTYSTCIEYDNAVTNHVVRLRCRPMNCHFQSIKDEHLTLHPDFWWAESEDSMGAKVLQGGMRDAHNTFYYISEGVVEHTSFYVIPDSNPHPMYLLPSSLTPFHDDMAMLFPEEIRDKKTNKPQVKSYDNTSFLPYCLSICHNVWQWMQYCPGATSLFSTARDAFTLRKGVCQDYAHLMISLCRAKGIPARYVCGLMEGEGQTHAWVETHDGQCWYAFDPTNDTAISENYIKIAHGRDANDCAVSRGAFNGITSQTTKINVIVKEI